MLFGQVIPKWVEVIRSLKGICRKREQVEFRSVYFGQYNLSTFTFYSFYAAAEQGDLGSISTAVISESSNHSQIAVLT